MELGKSVAKTTKDDYRAEKNRIAAFIRSLSDMSKRAHCLKVLKHCCRTSLCCCCCRDGRPRRIKPTTRAIHSPKPRAKPPTDYSLAVMVGRAEARHAASHCIQSTD